MANEPKTQWHPAFCSAMKLELIEDAEYLEYTSEYNLNTKPLEMDLLIVKKEKNIEIKNEIGKIFRLYKSYEEHVDDINLDDITITMVREKKPHKLFCWFEKNGYQINETYKGIYYVTREHHFPMQVIVSNRLSEASQKWLTLLSSNLKHKDAERIVWQMDGLTELSAKRYADSVLQVAMVENEQLFNKLKEERNVCEALRKLMEPEMKEAVSQAVEQTAADTTKNTIIKSLTAGNSKEDIARIMQVPIEEVEAIAKEILI